MKDAVLGEAARKRGLDATPARVLANPAPRAGPGAPSGVPARTSEEPRELDSRTVNRVRCRRLNFIYNLSGAGVRHVK